MVTARAKKHLTSADPVMAKLIGRFSVHTPRPRNDSFRFLTEIIIEQQLSGKAAATIHGRFLRAVGKKAYTPGDVLRTPTRKLRAAGISGAKVRYIQQLAHAVVSRKVYLPQLRTLSDAEIITELIKLSGIGQWSAEMYLLFALGRKDVFSVGDGGLQRAVQTQYRLRSSPDAVTMLKIAEPWKPYRSLASLYLWASLDQKEK